MNEAIFLTTLLIMLFCVYWYIRPYESQVDNRKFPKTLADHMTLNSVLAPEEAEEVIETVCDYYGLPDTSEKVKKVCMRVKDICNTGVGYLSAIALAIGEERASRKSEIKPIDIEKEYMEYLRMTGISVDWSTPDPKIIQPIDFEDWLVQKYGPSRVMAHIIRFPEQINRRPKTPPKPNPKPNL